MKVALLGYGKMGRIVEQVAQRSGLEVVCVVDPVGGSRGNLTDADVCIDFTEPSVVLGNIETAAEAGLSVVVGTTGWYDQIQQARQIVDRFQIGFIYGSNFSVGVNVMFRIVRDAAALFNKLPEYDAFIEEAHHKAKKDSPSGTAIFLKGIVDNAYGVETPVSSTRAGYIPGLHEVGFDSEADTLVISHTARNRAGFADGAVLAAKWIAGRKGFFEFSEAFEEIVSSSQSEERSRRSDV